MGYLPSGILCIDSQLMATDAGLFHANGFEANLGTIEFVAAIALQNYSCARAFGGIGAPDAAFGQMDVVRKFQTTVLFERR